MASSNVSYQNVAVKYGILVGIVYIVYFLVMWALGVIEVIELSFLSGLFLVIGIVVAISSYKKVRSGGIRYLEGFGIGATVGAVSSAILGLFLVVFLSTLDTEYLEHLQASSLFPEGLSLTLLFVLTILYGTVPGAWIAFIAMQWFKRRDHNTMPGQD